MLDFKHRKEITLHKMDDNDKSRKGYVDEEIKDLIDTINSKERYYTTSSCAGRIALTYSPEEGKKHEHGWLYVSHALIEDKESLIKAYHDSEGDDTPLWLNMNSSIIHICCKDLQSAEFLLDKARTSGWKHSGIFSNERRIIVQLMSNEFMSAIIAKDGKLLVDDDYMDIAIDEANKKLSLTREHIKELKEKLE